MSQGLDDGMVAIGARFGVTAGLGAGIGEGAETAAAMGAGLLRARKRPVVPFMLPPGILTATTVGAYLDLPNQFSPPDGWYWDVTSLSLFGFTAGAVGVSKDAPLITPAGNQMAVEPVASFTQAGVIQFPQHGMPLLHGDERLVFTVTSAITGAVQVSGSVVMIPAERIDEYMS